MARSERGRARQQARRDAYADTVLGNMARRLKKYDAPDNMMLWDEALAVAMPNHVSEADRRKLHELRETSPLAAMKMLVRLAGQFEHMPEAGRILQPPAGLKGRPTRTDVSIKPSWERVDNSPAVVHTCTPDDQSSVWYCLACKADHAEEARLRARH